MLEQTSFCVIIGSGRRAPPVAGRPPRSAARPLRDRGRSSCGGPEADRERPGAPRLDRVPPPAGPVALSGAGYRVDSRFVNRPPPPARAIQGKEAHAHLRISLPDL